MTYFRHVWAFENMTCFVFDTSRRPFLWTTLTWCCMMTSSGNKLKQNSHGNMTSLSASNSLAPNPHPSTLLFALKVKLCRRNESDCNVRVADQNMQCVKCLLPSSETPFSGAKIHLRVAQYRTFITVLQPVWFFRVPHQTIIRRHSWPRNGWFRKKISS